MLTRDLLKFVLEDNVQRVLTLILIGICLIGCFSNILSIVVLRLRSVIRHQLIRNSLQAAFICDAIFLFVEYLSATIPILLGVLEHQEVISSQIKNQDNKIAIADNVTSIISNITNQDKITNQDNVTNIKDNLSQYKLDLLNYQDLWMEIAYPISLIVITATIWTKCRLLFLIARESIRTIEGVPRDRETDKPDVSLRMILVGAILLNLIRFCETSGGENWNYIFESSLYQFWYLKIIFLSSIYLIPIPILFFWCYQLGFNYFKRLKVIQIMTFRDFKVKRQLRTFLSIFILSILLLITLLSCGLIMFVSSFILKNEFSIKISSLAFHFIFCINLSSNFIILYMLCPEFKIALNSVIFGLEDLGHVRRKVVFVEHGDIVKRIKRSKTDQDETLL